MTVRLAQLLTLASYKSILGWTLALVYESFCGYQVKWVGFLLSVKPQECLDLCQ